LVSNDDNLTTQPQQYSFNGATVTATDRRLYRPFSDTIAFRNRVQ
jgi:type IV pilus assembly protein PilW